MCTTSAISTMCMHCVQCIQNERRREYPNEVIEGAWLAGISFSYLQLKCERLEVLDEGIISVTIAFPNSVVDLEFND